MFDNRPEYLVDCRKDDTGIAMVTNRSKGKKK
jgi:hypothetical protein